MNKAKLKDLVGQDLKKFKIVEMTEVYQTDVEGRGKTNTVGFFKNPDIAKAFAEGHDYTFQTAASLVLTDGVTGFVIESQEPVKFFSDEEEVLKLKEKAMKKLTPAERKLLRLGEKK